MMDNALPNYINGAPHVGVTNPATGAVLDDVPLRGEIARTEGFGLMHVETGVVVERWPDTWSRVF